ncbi:hypothetical protein KUCAC02_032429, partial [Chaenocephalus aceratus]
ELSPAQWHVDVCNGDGWWLALSHRGTDGLLPKRLSAILHQSLSDSLPPPSSPCRLDIGLLSVCVSISTVRGIDFPPESSEEGLKLEGEAA